jgi:integrase/recombinase XerD
MQPRTVSATSILKLLPAVQTLCLEVTSKHTKRSYTTGSLLFLKWLRFEQLELDQLDYVTIVRYHAYLVENYSKKTAALRFLTCRRLLDVARKMHIIRDNPASEVKRKISFDDSGTHTALSKREAHKLLSAVDRSTPIGKRDYAVLLVLTFCGIRRSECAAIKLGDIREHDEHKVLTILHGKGDKRREIPLPPPVFRAIKDFLEAVDRLNDDPQNSLFTGFYRGQHSTGRGVTDRAIENIVKHYSQKSGIHCTPHDLRATSITLLVDTGAPLIQVQRLVGHKDPKTTERYYSRKQDLDSSPIYKISLND